MQDWKSVIIFLSVLILSFYVLKLELYISFGLSGICACLMNLCIRLEHFSQNNIVDEEVEEEDDDEAETDDEDDDDDEVETPKIDVTSTIEGALQNFDPKTLRDMTKDTKSLIKEQTDLMATISKMQPVIEKGMEMLDKYQGSGKTEELFNKFSNLQKAKN
tara:strand:- start:2691 stop:3173 length:483 start_codon:yes stop_codon:yes gene_type:complete